MFVVLGLQLQKMMSDNEGLPQIEKLSRHEFDLDIEEQKRLQAQCEVEVQKVQNCEAITSSKLWWRWFSPQICCLRRCSSLKIKPRNRQNLVFRHRYVQGYKCHIFSWFIMNFKDSYLIAILIIATSVHKSRSTPSVRKHIRFRFALFRTIKHQARPSACFGSQTELDLEIVFSPLI
jgi:hypothetical protein